MKQIIITIFILSNLSLFSDEDRNYDLEPILVEENFRFNRISSLDRENFVISGGIVINDDPSDFISNMAIYKSTDKGITWGQIYIDTNERLKESERFFNEIVDIHYLSKDIIVAICRTGYMLKTFNGGKDWIRDSIDLALDFYNSKFIDEQNGIIFCSRNLGPFKSSAEFLRTNNSGKTWEKFKIPIDSIMGEDIKLQTSSFSYTKDGLFHFTQLNSESINDTIVNIDNYIIKTTDMGITWEKLLLYEQDSINIRDPKTNKYISSTVQFISKEEALWMGATPSQTKTYGFNYPWEYPFLRHSTDGGQTWAELFYDNDSSSRSTSPDLLIKEDKDKYIFKSGLSGISVYEKGANNYVSVEPNNIKYLNENFNYNNSSDFEYLGDNEFLVTGNSDHIFKFNYSVPTRVLEYLEIEKTLLVYPNPVGKQATIMFELTSSTNVNLDIYDVAGNKVQTLIAEQMPINKYGITWIPNNLPSGAYFIKLTTDYSTFNQKVIVK